MMHSPRECENVQWKIPLDSNRDDRLWPMNVRRDTRLPALEVATYVFRVDHDYIIDATRRGNLINHCCDVSILKNTHRAFQFQAVWYRLKRVSIVL